MDNFQMTISGDEWRRCYLNDDGSEVRKKQIIKDLHNKSHSAVISGKVGDLITIDCEDHSSAFEQFIIKDIDIAFIELEYYGGGS